MSGFLLKSVFHTAGQSLSEPAHKGRPKQNQLLSRNHSAKACSTQLKTSATAENDLNYNKPLKIFAYLPIQIYITLPFVDLT